MSVLRGQAVISSKKMVAICFPNGVAVGGRYHYINCNCMRLFGVRSLEQFDTKSNESELQNS